MSKNIVDCIIKMKSPHIGLLPSRRQIDFNGGYVNNWNTELFVKYVRQKSSLIIERDHAGVGQGDTNEYDSYNIDAISVDIIHIDPWKKYPLFNDGLNETIVNIKHIYNLNQDVLFEIGTEEAIRKFDVDELHEFVTKLKDNLTENEFKNIVYLCIQSGVGLDLINRKNTGTFDLCKMKQMIDVGKKFNMRSKEHNGDYLSIDNIKMRFDNGLDSINIGPELIQIETDVYLDCMTEIEINKFYNICLKSEKWKKWVTSDFDYNDKRKLISICGHYNYNKLNIHLNNSFPIDKHIETEINKKLNKLLNYV